MHMWRTTSNRLLAAMAALLIPCTANAAVEVLEPGRLVLRGTIQRSDIDEIARLLPLHESPDVLVFAWGTGETAWEVVHEMTKLLESADVTVEHHYSEDAAAAIGGRKTEFPGTLLVTKQLDIDRDAEIPVRVWTDDGTTWTSRTVSESLAPTIDRFDLHCKGNIPREAESLGLAPHKIAGRIDSHIDRRGLRDALNETWFYKRTGRTGRWSHEPADKLRDLIEKSRKTADRRLDMQRRAAEKRQGRR